MRSQLAIEDIEQMRIREGIDDVELREAIRKLVVGDLVKLTVFVGSTTPKMMLVRIREDARTRRFQRDCRRLSPGGVAD